MSWTARRAHRIFSVWKVIPYNQGKPTSDIDSQTHGSDVRVSLLLLERKGYIENLSDKGPNRWVRIRERVLDLDTIKGWLE